jgi:hypothetical protein
MADMAEPVVGPSATVQMSWLAAHVVKCEPSMDAREAKVAEVQVSHETAVSCWRCAACGSLHGPKHTMQS